MNAIDASAELDDAGWMAARMRSASAGAAVNTIMSYLGQALSLVTIPIYLTHLGQEQYGLMLLLATLQSYLSQANLGLNWAAMNMIGAARATGDTREFVMVVQNAMLLAAATAAAALAASVGLAAASQFGLAEALQLSDGLDPWAIVAAGLLAALSLGGGPVYLTFVGMGQSSTAAFYQGLARLLAVPLMATIAFNGGGIASMFAASAAVLFSLQIVATVHLLRRFPSLVSEGPYLSRLQCRRQLLMGVKNMSAELGFMLHATAPTVALGVTCGAAAVPLYSVPKALMEAALTFGRSQYSILQPAYAEAARHGRTTAIARMLSRSLTRNATLLGLLMAGFIVLCGPFVEVWTGGRLSVGRATATAIGIGTCAIFFVQLFQLFLISIERQLAATRILVATGVLGLTAMTLAGWSDGFDAVAWMAAVVGCCTAAAIGAVGLQQVFDALPIGRSAARSAYIGLNMAATIVAGMLTLNALSDVVVPLASIGVTGVVMVAVYALGVNLAPRRPALDSAAPADG